MFWRLGFWKKDKEAHMTINNDNNKEVILITEFKFVICLIEIRIFIITFKFEVIPKTS